MTLLGVSGTHYGAIFTSIGTVGAVTLVLGSAFRRWFQRPKFEVVVNRVEPYLRLINNPDGSVSTELRVGIKNVGRTEAKHARIQIRGLYHLKESVGDSMQKWLPLDLDPLPLPWASRLYLPSGEDEVVNIPSQLDDFVVLIEATIRNREIKLNPKHQTAGLLRSDFGIGEYRIKLVIVAENAKPKTAIIAFNQEMEELIAAPRLSDHLPKHKVQPLGYYDTLSQSKRKVPNTELQ